MTKVIKTNGDPAPDLVCDLIDIIQNVTNAGNVLGNSFMNCGKDITDVFDYDKFGLQVSFHTKRALQMSAELKEFATNMEAWAMKRHDELKLLRFRNEQH